VEIGKDDVDLKINDEAWLWNDWSDLFRTSLYIQQTIYKNLKKETYKTLFREYQEYNDQDDQEIGYVGVKINGSVLSFEPNDLGRVKFYRVKGKASNNK
jgi:hypothetical protein